MGCGASKTALSNSAHTAPEKPRSKRGAHDVSRTGISVSGIRKLQEHWGGLDAISGMQLTDIFKDKPLPLFQEPEYDGSSFCAIMSKIHPECFRSAQYYVSTKGGISLTDFCDTIEDFFGDWHLDSNNTFLWLDIMCLSKSQWEESDLKRTQASLRILRSFPHAIIPLSYPPKQMDAGFILEIESCLDQVQNVQFVVARQQGAQLIADLLASPSIPHVFLKNCIPNDDSLVNRVSSLWFGTLIESRIAQADNEGDLSEWTQSLASLYQCQGFTAKSIDTYLRCLQRMKDVDVRGLGSSNAITVIKKLTNIWNSGAHYDQSIPLWEESLTRRLQTQFPQDEITLESIHTLACQYLKAGQTSKAEPLLAKNLKHQRVLFGEQDARTLASQNALAQVFIGMKSYEMAAPLLQRALSIERKQFAQGDARTASTILSLSRVYAVTMQYDLAATLLREYLSFPAFAKTERFEVEAYEVQSIEKLIKLLEDNPKGIRTHSDILRAVV
ncbi:hypothetical protein BC830DRAFT_171829 [Chytriomyces sp. MP71]|nr:hypothetical protein BC830DRAFT_171829 [Chytriomyces sp. MP71]